MTDIEQALAELEKASNQLFKDVSEVNACMRWDIAVKNLAAVRSKEARENALYARASALVASMGVSQDHVDRRPVPAHDRGPELRRLNEHHQRRGLVSANFKVGDKIVLADDIGSADNQADEVTQGEVATVNEIGRGGILLTLKEKNGVWWAEMFELADSNCGPEGEDS